MSDEDAFLRKILENPADDVTRLVYADWLEERNEMAKVEFLRLEVEIENATNPPPKSFLQRMRIKSYDPVSEARERAKKQNPPPAG